MMLYLIAAGVVLGLLFFGPGRGLLKLPAWRYGAAAGAIAALAGAAFCLVERKWVGAVVLGVMGLWLASTARFPRAAGQPKAAPEPKGRMSLSEARSMLGVGSEATKAEIKAAYARLIQRAHPDKGGSAGLAAQLNAARDRLLKP